MFQYLNYLLNHLLYCQLRNFNRLSVYLQTEWMIRMLAYRQSIWQRGMLSLLSYRFSTSCDRTLSINTFIINMTILTVRQYKTQCDLIHNQSTWWLTNSFGVTSFCRIVNFWCFSIWIICGIIYMNSLSSYINFNKLSVYLQTEWMYNCLSTIDLAERNAMFVII
jgi:presenilin-like A22 family membrane protease